MLVRTLRQPAPPVNYWPVALEELAIPSISSALTWGRAAWPSANRGIYLPCRLPFDAYLTGMSVDCSSTTGTLDLGLFADDNTKIATRGATTNTIGIATWTLTNGIWMRAGSFYTVAMSVSSTTPQYSRMALTAVNMRAIGFAQEASVATLPATITPAVVASAYVPLIVLRFGNAPL